MNEWEATWHLMWLLSPYFLALLFEIVFPNQQGYRTNWSAPSSSPPRGSIVCPINVYLIRSSLCTDTIVIITPVSSNTPYHIFLHHTVMPCIATSHVNIAHKNSSQRGFTHLTDFCVRHHNVANWIKSETNRLGDGHPSKVFFSSLRRPNLTWIVCNLTWATCWQSCPNLFRLRYVAASIPNVNTRSFFQRKHKRLQLGCHGYP